MPGLVNYPARRGTPGERPAPGHVARLPILSRKQSAISVDPGVRGREACAGRVPPACGG
jgi:hypothetical protein